MYALGPLKLTSLHACAIIIVGHEGAFINIFIPIIDKCARVIARL